MSSFRQENQRQIVTATIKALDNSQDFSTYHLVCGPYWQCSGGIRIGETGRRIVLKPQFWIYDFNYYKRLYLKHFGRYSHTLLLNIFSLKRRFQGLNLNNSSSC